MYTAHSRVDRGNLVFFRILEALRVDWWNSTPHFASRAERKKYKKKIRRVRIEPTTYRANIQTLCRCATTDFV